VLAGLYGCARQPSSPPRKEVTIWHALGSWSGHSGVLTGSFTSDTGLLRIDWETKGETKPNAGTFRLTINSAVSGRAIATVVDQRGVGHDTAYLSEDPHDFYATVESSSIDWAFTVEEGTSATVEDKPASH
jgi:hypothetical protein